MRSRNVGIPHHESDGVAIDGALPFGMHPHRLQLGRKEERRSAPTVIERFLAEPIAHQVEHAVAAIPDGKGEHPDKPVEGRNHAPPLRGGEDHFSIRSSTVYGRPAWPLAQCVSHFTVVVDLAVEDHHVTAAFGRHRLMSCRRHIDNREAAMTERDAGRRIDPMALVIGTAMSDRQRHPPKRVVQINRSGSAVDEAGYSTHIRRLLSASGAVRRAPIQKCVLFFVARPQPPLLAARLRGPHRPAPLAAHLPLPVKPSKARQRSCARSPRGPEPSARWLRQ